MESESIFMVNILDVKKQGFRNRRTIEKNRFMSINNDSIFYIPSVWTRSKKGLLYFNLCSRLF